MALNIWYRGDTIQGTFKLGTVDSCTGIRNAFEIGAGSTLQMRFPGATSTVTITSGASEIVVTNADNGEGTFTISATKSALLKVGEKQGIDMVVTDVSNVITTFEKLKTVTIKDRVN